MVATPPIVLRYFDARGRAEFIRCYFSARDVDYTDDRVPLSPDFAEWREMRDDSTRTGPFKKLPVLHFGDEVVAEALVIAAFLHERLGDARALSPAQNGRHAMLLSSLYCEMVLPVGMLLWAERAYEGIDLGAYARQALGRLVRHMEVLDATLAEWGWVEGIASRPVTLADCLLWDQLRDVEELFAGTGGFDLARFSTLQRFFREHPARTAFAAPAAEKPAQITGTPDEAAVVAKIRTLLAMPADLIQT